MRPLTNLLVWMLLVNETHLSAGAAESVFTVADYEHTVTPNTLVDAFFISLAALAAENEPVQLSPKLQGALCCGRFVSSP